MGRCDRNPESAPTTVVYISNNTRNYNLIPNPSYSDFKGIKPTKEYNNSFMNLGSQIHSITENLNTKIAFNQLGSENYAISRRISNTNHTDIHFPVSHRNLVQMNRSELATKNSSGKPLLMNAPTRIERGQMRFLILDMPNNSNLGAYVQEMKSYNVQHLVRTCTGDYMTSTITQANITVHDLIFEDGGHPPLDIIKKWQEIVKTTNKTNGAVAVHCVAGLGRAPTLVGISLIDSGMDPARAINTIREARQGALNSKQIEFLLKYRKGSCIQRCIFV